MILSFTVILSALISLLAAAGGSALLAISASAIALVAGCAIGFNYVEYSKLLGCRLSSAELHRAVDRLRFKEQQVSSELLKLQHGQAKADATAADPRSFDLGNWLSQALLRVAPQFSCVTTFCALRQKGETGWRVFPSGIRGPRFESIVARFLEIEGTSIKLGEISHFNFEQHPVLSADLRLFGVRMVLMRQFFFDVRDQRCECCIGFGYGVQALPSEVEKVRFSEYCNNLESTIPLLLKMKMLSHDAEEAEVASQQKSEFLTHMSHDIRAPLNNISAALRLVEQPSDVNERKEMLDLALRNCAALNEMLEAILDFSRHRVGRLHANPEVVNLYSEVQNLAKIFVPQAQLRGLRLELRGDASMPCFALLDSRHVRRVLQNLLSNAIKFTEVGGVKVTTSIENGFVSVAVSDTGLGMSPEQLKSLFQPFTRLHGQKVDGIGLGLALSKALVQLNGGELTAKSTAGAGSCFTVKFPACPSQEASAEPARASGGSRSSPESVPGGILLVDDDRDYLETTRRLFRLRGANVQSAQSIQEAAQILSQQSPRIVLCDKNLPDGGPEKLVHLFSGGVHRPEFFLCSGSDESGDSRWQKLGVRQCFLKPLSAEQISWLSEQSRLD